MSAQKICDEESRTVEVPERGAACTAVSRGQDFQPCFESAEAVQQFWKRPVGNCLKTTSERLQSSPVIPLPSLKEWLSKAGIVFVFSCAVLKAAMAGDV